MGWIFSSSDSGCGLGIPAWQQPGEGFGRRGVALAAVSLCCPYQQLSQFGDNKGLIPALPTLSLAGLFLLSRNSEQGLVETMLLRGGSSCSAPTNGAGHQPVPHQQFLLSSAQPRGCEQPRAPCNTSCLTAGAARRAGVGDGGCVVLLQCLL